MPTTRDVVRPKPPAQRRHGTTRTPARDAVAEFVSMAEKFCRDFDSVTETMARNRDNLARLQPIAEARKAVKMADAAYEARVARCTPVNVQAANAARWPRTGR